MISKKSVVAVAVAFAAIGANAATYTFAGPTGEIANPGSVSWSFNAVAADPAASLNLLLNGFRSLDGLNPYSDFFTINVNGSDIGTGSFNLGGGGFSAWGGAGNYAYTSPNPGTAVTWAGGQISLTGVQLALNAGSNNITFSYSPVGYANGAGQGLGDEAWGIGAASVTAVPEPETYAMLLAGLGLMGTIARRRKQAKQG